MSESTELHIINSGRDLSVEAGHYLQQMEYEIRKYFTGKQFEWTNPGGHMIKVSDGKVFIDGEELVLSAIEPTVGNFWKIQHLDIMVSETIHEMCGDLF
jgi:hypothetical protein